MSTWQNIPHSMFDFEGFYLSMAQSLPAGCRIAEVGVADGASSIYLAEKLFEIGKGFRLRMIDNLDYGRSDQLKTILDNVQKSGLSEFIEIIPIDSLNASLKYPDGYFDFVFLDSGHTFELTKAEIRLWQHKVKDGGFLAGHDYHGSEGVRQAVDELIPANQRSTYETTKGYGIWSFVKDPLNSIK